MTVAVTHIAADGGFSPTSPRDVPGTHTFVAGNYYVIISTSQSNASALTLQPPSGGALSLVDSFNATNLGTSGYNVLGRVYLCTTGSTGTARITFTSGLVLIAYAIAEVSGSDGITQTTSVQTATDTTSISPTGISGVGADDRAVWLFGGSTGGNINVSGATRLTQADASGRRAVVIHDTDGTLTISNIQSAFNAVKGYRFHAAPPPAVNTCVVSMW